MNDSELLRLLESVREAIAKHPQWRGTIEYHFLRFDEDGWSVKVFVKPSRQRSVCEIHENGETAEAACANLIAKLDMWWEVCNEK